MQISGVNISIGLMLALVGLMIILRTRQQLDLAERVKSWRTVSGVVIHSRIRVESDSEGDSYEPEIACRYTIDAETYISSRHTLAYTQSAAAAKELVAAFPPGLVVDLRVDPQAPEAAVLITGVPQQMRTLQGIGWAALLAGVGLVLSGLRALLHA